MKPAKIASGLLAAALAAGPGCAPDPPPATPLRERVEARLAALPTEVGNLDHWALVREISQEELGAFMARIVVWRAGPDLALGSVDGVELHGAGVLRMLTRLWRPGGRAPRLDDRYPFASPREPLALSTLLDAYRRQVFLPVPGVAPEALGGRLPEAPQLARVRLGGLGPGGGRELDAYALLDLLVRYDEDPSVVWTNRLGQPLSTRRLLDQAWEHYLVPREPDAEAADHTYLHLVEVLLAWARREDVARDPEAIQRRLLGVELEREAFGAWDPTEALGHYAESLGLLVADPAVDWSEAERRQARAWLDGLEARGFDDLEAVPIQHLTHLLSGLRAVAAHAERLR